MSEPLWADPGARGVAYALALLLAIYLAWREDRRSGGA